MTLWKKELSYIVQNKPAALLWRNAKYRNTSDLGSVQLYSKAHCANHHLQNFPTSLQESSMTKKQIVIISCKYCHRNRHMSETQAPVTNECGLAKHRIESRSLSLIFTTSYCAQVHAQVFSTGILGQVLCGCPVHLIDYFKYSRKQAETICINTALTLFMVRGAFPSLNNAKA